MRTVHIHGEIGQKFGKSFDLEVETAAEAFQALFTNFPEMKDEVRKGAFYIVRGKTAKHGTVLNEKQAAGMRLGKSDLHIVPEISGSKSNGAKAIIGVAMVAMSVGTFGMSTLLATPISTSLMGATTWGNAIGMAGLSMAVSGASSMLSADSDDEDDSSDLASNVSAMAQEGTPIPLVYGKRVLVKGMTISAAIEIDRVNSNGDALSSVERDRAALREILGDDAVTG